MYVRMYLCMYHMLNLRLCIPLLPTRAVHTSPSEASAGVMYVCCSEAELPCTRRPLSARACYLVLLLCMYVRMYVCVRADAIHILNVDRMKFKSSMYRSHLALNLAQRCPLVAVRRHDKEEGRGGTHAGKHEEAVCRV